MLISKNVLYWCPILLIALLAAWYVSAGPVAQGVSAEAYYTMVIDAGHGGEDGGAVASNGTLESDINLDIALRLKALADFWGVSSVMTREGSGIEYPAGADTLSQMKRADQNARVELISSTPGAILVSIHQNYYPSEKPSGIQVFYGGVEGSLVLAEVMQQNLTEQLCPENRRVAAPIDSGIYLMRKAECPAVLVECGFLSNPTERSKLEDPTYRGELAAVMLASYLQYTKGTIK